MDRQTEALSNLITLKLGKCLLIVKLIDAEKTMSEHDLFIRASVYGLRTDSALTAKMLENLLPAKATFTTLFDNKIYRGHDRTLTAIFKKATLTLNSN